MRFRVEYPLIQIKLLLVCEEQVQVLERFSQEKRLHHVFWPQVQWISYIAYCSVAVENFGVLLNSLKIAIYCKVQTKNGGIGVPEKYSIPNLGKFCFR